MLAPKNKNEIKLKKYLDIFRAMDYIKNMEQEQINITAKQNELVAVREVLLQWADEEVRDWKISSQEDKEKFSKILNFVNKINETFDCDFLLNL